MTKTNIKYILSIIAFIASLVCGFIALFIPPKGIIDTSVLWWCAQLLAFTAAVLGIDFNINKNYKNIKE